MKDSYIKGDKLTFNVTVKNKIDEAVDAVKLSANISDGYKIVSNQSNAIDLGASEIKTYKITAEENKNGVDSPKTGIGYPVFYIILFVLAVILAFKTRKCKKICSLIITVVFLASFSSELLIFNAFADPVIQTAASADFKYDSKSGKLTVTAETKRDETVVIDKSSFDGPSTVGLYGIDKEITTLNGKLHNSRYRRRYSS